MRREELLAEEEISEELRRVRREMPESEKDAYDYEAPMNDAREKSYDPGLLDRTGFGVGSADPPEANQLPSEMDVKKPACASEFSTLVEGWIHGGFVSSPNRRPREPLSFFQFWFFLCLS